ncbi:SUMF1/EgtB/PvdO family nonheme iron enzyme, partial [bacterium]|nr:SUMF1/EgtB/PvdO family nonheme iron enzyme [bacterium]
MRKRLTNRYVTLGVLISMSWVLGCRHTTPGNQEARTSELNKQLQSIEAGSYKAGDTRSINIPGTDVSIKMVYVPGGEYTIGSPAGEDGRTEDEGPQRVVTISPYWISQFEASDDEYSIFRFADRDADTTAVVGATYSVDGVSRPSPPYEDPAFGLGGSGKPAVGMTQWGALHFAHWLTEKTGVFFRLPTEAEW